MSILVEDVLHAALGEVELVLSELPHVHLLGGRPRERMIAHLLILGCLFSFRERLVVEAEVLHGLLSYRYSCDSPPSFGLERQPFAADHFVTTASFYEKLLHYDCIQHPAVVLDLLTLVWLSETLLLLYHPWQFVYL